jgi:hypothetical protein
MEAENFSAAFDTFLREEVKTACVRSDGRFCAGEEPPKVLLPGAFNPLHAGHWGMAEAACRITGMPVSFELSVANVDKPPLAAAEILARIRQFGGRGCVWLTRAPTFVEKAALFPGALFVLGVDTADRIIAPRYYDNSEDKMLAAMEGIRSRGCRFLVAGRVESGGKFVRLQHLAIPKSVADLFSEIPEAEFRLDISSTQIRLQ